LVPPDTPPPKHTFTVDVADFARESIIRPTQPFQLIPGKDPNGWQFVIEPYGWAMGVSGVIGVKGLPPIPIYSNAKSLIQSLDWAVFCKAEIRKGRWGLLGDGYFAALSATQSPEGKLVESGSVKIGQGIASLALAYRIIDDRRGFLDLYVGARYNYLGASVQSQANPSVAAEVGTSVTNRIASVVNQQVTASVDTKIAQLQAQAGDDQTVFRAALNNYRTAFNAALASDQNAANAAVSNYRSTINAILSGDRATVASGIQDYRAAMQNALATSQSDLNNAILAAKEVATGVTGDARQAFGNSLTDYRSALSQSVRSDLDNQVSQALDTDTKRMLHDEIKRSLVGQGGGIGASQREAIATRVTDRISGALDVARKAVDAKAATIAAKTAYLVSAQRSAAALQVAALRNAGIEAIGGDVNSAVSAKEAIAAADKAAAQEALDIDKAKLSLRSSDATAAFQNYVQAAIDARVASAAAQVAAAEGRLDAAVASLKAAADQRLAQAKAKLAAAIAGGLENELNKVASQDVWWVDPIIGLRAQVNLTRWLFLGAQADVGGLGWIDNSFGSQIAWNVQASVGFNITRNVFAEVGYRYMYTNYANDGFLYQLNSFGLFSGIGVKF